ncbi:MAG: VTT domain-containing protein [Schleiferiaceae bacterium]|nr:VTT domain-containing protein [Schleiferiaceae bacterium]
MAGDKDFLKRSNLTHEYYKRKGGYRFLGQNFLKLLIFLAIAAAGLYAFSEFVLDINSVTNYIFKRFEPWFIVLTLFISESFTGILPPDLYILWAADATVLHPWILVFILATVSYLGGVISYAYGTQLIKIRWVHRYVNEKFAEQFEQIRRFGGLLIFIAAIAPLPFSPISVVAGVVKFPFRKYLFVALSRYVRFFLYALVLFLFF